MDRQPGGYGTTPVGPPGKVLLSGLTTIPPHAIIIAGLLALATLEC